MIFASSPGGAPPPADCVVVYKISLAYWQVYVYDPHGIVRLETRAAVALVTEEFKQFLLDAVRDEFGRPHLVNGRHG